MTPRKPVARVPSADLPPYMCSQCWYYAPVELDHGTCYGVPPTPLMCKDGEVMYPRTVVLAEDSGCGLWKPRHVA